MAYRIRLLLVVCAGWSSSDARAQDGDNSLHGYVLAGAGTTVMYVPNRGHLAGPLGDVSPTLAAGWFATPTISLEFDAYMTFTADGYAATGGGPAISWAFDPHAFGALRLFVPIDPDMNLVVLPGVGLTHTFQNNLAPFLELDLASAFGRGHPDLALAPSAGLSYLF